MAVIKSGATTDQLTVDPTSKAARSTIYNSAGVEQVPVTENGILTRPYVIGLTQNILNQATPAGNTTYTSSTVQMMFAGYNVAKFIVKSSGTGTVPIQVFIFGSYDGTTWFNEPFVDCYLRSPINGTLCEGFIDIQTCFQYVKVVCITEATAPSSSIIIDVIRTNNVIGDNLVVFSGCIDDKKSEYRGFYQVNLNVDGVATINYIYMAIFNPAANINNVSIESLAINSVYTTGATLTTNIRMELIRITSMTGGTPLTANKINNDYAAPNSLISSANPTVTVQSILQNFAITGNSNYPMDFYLNPSNENYEIILKPGEGIAFRTPIALSTNHIITLNATFGCELP